MHTLIAISLAALTSLQTPAATTRFVTSNDGTRVAYDVTGSGPVVILLHGGGQDRTSWHRAGYVARLAKEFTVVTLDIRGNGESDKPLDVAGYHFTRLDEDILAVADAIKAPRFALWGFSYGANVGRVLASRSDRVTAMVYIGIPFGPAVDEIFMSHIKRMPSPPAWITALIGNPSVEPSEMKCPTLWVVGSRNEGAVASAQRYRDKLAGTTVTLAMVDGLDHTGEFVNLEQVFPRELEFTRANAH